MKIIFCGDVMPGGVLPYQKEYITKEVKNYLKLFDLRIGTLEAAIGTDIPYDETKMNGRMNIVYARNEDFFRVKELNFDIVSLANNHVFDLGEEGLRNTIDILKRNNIKYCGAGLNYEEASKPAVIERNGKSIAILAYCMYGNKYLGYVELAGKDKAGVNPLDIDQVVTDIRKYKKIYDYVVVMPHWGREYQYLPMLECKDMSLQMIDAGADAIIGGHAHNIQPCIKYKGKPIYFCLANFLFPDYYMHPPRPIWYPDSSYDVKSISKSYCYPDHIDNPTTSVWRNSSRVGMVVEMDVNDTIKTRYRFVYLSKNNILQFYSKCNSILKRLKLYLMGKLIKSNAYPSLKNCYESKYNLPIRGWHFIYRKLRLNNIFD
ncbi:MAG: CapA family protein [Rikenellaceae bacterium]|nr:CapA family protein [Rikenellaceae bacterium]